MFYITHFCNTSAPVSDAYVCVCVFVLVIPLFRAVSSSSSSSERSSITLQRDLVLGEKRVKRSVLFFTHKDKYKIKQKKRKGSFLKHFPLGGKNPPLLF